MSWRGTTTQDRVLAFLPYLIPFVKTIAVATMLVARLPLTESLVSLMSTVVIATLPLLQLLTNFTVDIILFLALYLLVVRNEGIPHFIRFNTMQALLLDIVLVLFGAISEVLAPIPGLNFIILAASPFIALGVVAVVIFALVQCLRGIYAEIPTLSAAAHAQVR